MGYIKGFSVRRKNFRINRPDFSKFRKKLSQQERPRRHLPLGTGPYTVGCVDVMSGPSTVGVFARLYYPTHSTNIFERQEQWPLWLPRKQYLDGYMEFKEVNKKVFGKIFNLIGGLGDMYAPVLWQAPLLDEGSRWPVIIFSHGIGANRTTYTTICVDLASHGFVVAAMEHRDGSASMTYCLRAIPFSNYLDDDVDDDDVTEINDVTSLPLRRENSFIEEWLKYDRFERLDDYHLRNKQLYRRVDEVSVMLDFLEALNSDKEAYNILGFRFDMGQFKDMLDIDKVAIVGHSFGGATSIGACSRDKRFKVAVALDSWMLPLDDSCYRKCTQPVLMYNSETFQWKNNVKAMLKLKSDSVERKMITLSGSCHQTATDFQFMVRPILGKLLQVRYVLPPETAMDLTVKGTLGFVCKHLGIARETFCDDIIEGRHPQIIRGSNIDIYDDLVPDIRIPTNKMVSFRYLCTLANTTQDS